MAPTMGDVQRPQVGYQCSHLLLLCQIQVVFLLEDSLNKQSDDLVTLFGTTQKREQKTGTGHIDLQKANTSLVPTIRRSIYPSG